MKQRHTPGGWNAEGLKVISFGSGIIAKCILPQDGGCFDAIANAKIIAAAPNMLDACYLALKELREFYNDNESESIKVLKAAIKKATE